MRYSRPVRPPDTVLNTAYVYAILTRDVQHGRTEIGYVGQTARDPYVRLAEHRETQPWADLIVHPEIIVVWAGRQVLQSQLDTMERWYIRNGVPHPDGTGSYRPRYNIEHNMDNSARTLPWTAIAQRQDRDPLYRAPSRPLRRTAAPAAGHRAPGMELATSTAIFFICAFLFTAAVLLALFGGIA